MIRLKTVLTLIVVLTLPAIGSAASAERLEETFDQVLAFSQGDLLELGNTNGRIQIDTWDRDEIRIEAVKKARRRLQRWTLQTATQRIGES